MIQNAVTSTNDLSLCDAIAAHPLGKISNVTSTDFQSLCRDMQGAFPELVRQGIAGAIKSDEPPPVCDRSIFDLNAPEPSPVDYDWRFDSPTARRLARTLLGNTRPSAQVERDALIDRFCAIGKISSLPYEAVYATPPFEAEVLARLGLPVLPSWRAADLLQIELFPQAKNAPVPSQDWPLCDWERFVLGDQVIALRHTPGDDGRVHFEAEPSVELLSVSNRDPKRTHYTLWTSRSRAADRRRGCCH